MTFQFYDDFLPQEVFDDLTKFITNSSDFPWFFSESMTYDNDNQYQFFHNIYNVRRGGVTSDYFPLFEPVLEKLGVKHLDRIKINLNPRTFAHETGGWHIDNHPTDPYQHTKTSILYLNSNNGSTEFKNFGRVEVKPNRIVTFDSSVTHRKVTCTDNAKRVIVNFNYDI